MARSELRRVEGGPSPPHADLHRPRPREPHPNGARPRPRRPALDPLGRLDPTKATAEELRGIKDSPPYLHDGRLLTLEDTVLFFDVVLGTKLTAAEKSDLVAYLRAL